MENSQNQQTRKIISESPEVVERYEVLKRIGKPIFHNSHIAKTGEVNRDDVIDIAKKYLQEAITATNPEVRATYFEHLIIAPELGRRIAETVREKVDGVNPDEVEFLLWFHDLGRLASPGAFYRNDLITERLLYEFGIKEDLRKKLPPLRDVEEAAEHMDMTEEQIKAKQSLIYEQEKQAEDFFNSLTPTQIIINLADNLGKRDDKGGLFNLQSFHKYVQTYDARSKQDDKNNISWPSVNWAVEHRPEAARLQALVVDKAVDWLKEKGVNINEVLAGLTNYGPKFVAVMRHGELDNPRDVTYNRDKDTETIHINEKGRKMMQALGETIKKRIFRIATVYTSPETRAKESAEALLKGMSSKKKFQVRTEIDDVCAPGAFIEGISLTEWLKKNGNAYDQSRWKNYKHETQPEIVERMKDFFWQISSQLKTGQTAAMISHGDPIAHLIYYLLHSKIIDPKLIPEHTPLKGQANIFIFDTTGRIFSHYLLKGPELIEGVIY